MNREKFILDACCGCRMFWFDKHQRNTIYMDVREVDDMTKDRRKINVSPDVKGDFRNMPFPDKSFRLVVFDPPHLKRAGASSWLARKYGKLDPETWQDDLRAGFLECFRVLIPGGILVFKWNEEQIKIIDVVRLAPEQPLFGQRKGKTHWLVFMKPTAKEKDDEIKKVILDALEAGAINYSLESWNTGDCILHIDPIHFHREIPPPPLDPAAKKYIILLGNESEEERNRLEAKYNGNVEFLPLCTEIKPFAGMQCELRVNGRVIAYCDQRNVLLPR